MLANCTYGPGSLGCALSHIEMWKKAVEEETPLTVMEDDVRCIPDFYDRAGSVLDVLGDDWDIILWGYLFKPLFMWLDLGLAKAKLSPYDARSAEAFSNLGPALAPSVPIRIAHVFGLQAYSVSPMGARRLLSECLPLRAQHIRFPGTEIVVQDSGIDCATCRVYPEMKAFVCIPPLAIHDDDGDSIRLRTGG
jgi:hypothetical protein